MKRCFDIITVINLIIILLPLIFFISLLILIFDGRLIFHFSKRIGINNSFFLMPKFRTMNLNTPNVATHLLDQSNNHITFFGNFLRKTSLDELPQLFTVLKGEMSMVGPRPALYNQFDLISLRKKLNIHTLKPGITGYSQINGRDNLSIGEKVKLDQYYFENYSFFFDLIILIKTLFKIFKIREIKH